MKISCTWTSDSVFWITIVLLLCQTHVATGEESQNVTCQETQYQCADGKRCIPVSWRCDNDEDCDDDSDEIGCPGRTCSENEFQCQNFNHKCIPERWMCDNDEDCPDGSDENEDTCAHTQTHCREDQFRCDNGQCISGSYRCDGSSDCKLEDGEDEANCSNTVASCDSSEFQCNNGQCIQGSWECDYEEDCKDGSDEIGCGTPKPCKEDEFRCNDGRCIKQNWLCDGDLDCNDASDEKNSDCNATVPHCSENHFQCRTSKECIHSSWYCDSDKDCEDESDEDCDASCKSTEFMCAEDKYCLSRTLLCDGSEDCQDGSDEKKCNRSCGEDQFDCGDKCISKLLVCDGSNDCSNFADESPELGCSKDPCKDNNGGCDQVCVNLFRNQHRCDCHPGFKLMNGSKTVCDDVDECKDNHIHGACSQICMNTKGSYKCDCMEDYFLVDNRYCKAQGSHPELLLADRKDLRKIHLETFNYRLLLGDNAVFGAIAMDFDYSEKRFFWSDVTLEKIFTARFDNTSAVVPVIERDLHTPDGLAIDWINKNIYWTDTGFDRIEVASMDGQMRKTLISDGLDEPRAIVLDPKHGYMYWTDWGKMPKIERCGMNGQDRQIIVDQNITWPNGLTIDYAANRLYWIDAKLHTIESSNLDGTDRNVVLQSHRHLNHPFAITVFEDYVYWTDWPSESVKKYSKFGRGEVETIALNLHSPMDVHVFHPYRQQHPKIKVCDEQNNGCSDFCLPKAVHGTPSKFDYTCECMNGRVKKANDVKSCIEGDDTHTPVVTRPTPGTSKPDSPNSSHNQNQSSTGSHTDATTKKIVPITKLPSTQEPVEVTTEGHNVYTVINPTNHSEHNAPRHFDDQNIGHIAGIVIGILLVLVLIAGVVCFILYKRYSRNHGKSMNFDNPVYRKTTTEELIIEKNNRNLPPSMQPLTQPTNEIV